MRLLRAGHRVTVLTTTAGIAEFADRRDPVERTVDGVKVVYSPLRFVPRLYLAPQLLEGLGATRPDVIHSHGLFLLPGIQAYRLAKSLSVPSIVSPRGMLMRRAISSRNELLKLTAISSLEWARLRESALHFTSTFELAESMRTGAALGSSSVVPLGIDLPSVDPLPPQFRVGYLGRIAAEKNLESLIEACVIAKVPLRIAGEINTPYGEQLREQAGDEVRFVGRVEPKDRNQFFREVSVVALPSLFESFGNAAAEALSAGRPVIVSRTTGIAEYVAGGRAGLLVGVGAHD
ncbi:MAG: glycosyltransferase family 4 protein, partial [Myxococcota bacterium]